MIRHPSSVDDGNTAPRMLRRLAAHAQRILNDPAYNDPTESDPSELQALLHQIAHLERQFQSPHPTELQRWLSRVREMVEDRQALARPTKATPLRVAR